MPGPCPYFTYYINTSLAIKKTITACQCIYKVNSNPHNYIYTVMLPTPHYGINCLCKENTYDNLCTFVVYSNPQYMI